MVTDLKAEYGNTEITTFVDKIVCGATYATILNHSNVLNIHILAFRGHRVPASDTLVWHVGFPKAKAEYNKTIVAFGFVVLFNRERSLVITLSLSIDWWLQKKSHFPLVA